MAGRSQSAGASRRASTGIRSGRFSIEATTEEVTIIKAHVGAFYRILNPGTKPFTVYDGANSNTVEESQSLDFAVKSTVRVSAAAVPADGIYEYLELDGPVRSGRFKREVTGESETHKIIDLRGGGNLTAFYRVLNSGEWPIRITPFETVVLPENSFDFAVGSTPEVNVKFDDLEDARAIRKSLPPGPYVIEGIYDLLGTRNPVRSGRFKIRKLIDGSETLVDPSEDKKHMIIDVEDAISGRRAWYRIFNSGDNPIYVHGPTQDVGTLKPGYSLDVEIPDGSTKKVFVKSGDIDKSIEGIYDFLGEE